jgi:hypothetical protein
MMLLGACASSITLSEPPLARLTASGALEGVRVSLGRFDGDGCFRQEIARYLDQPGGLRLAAEGQPVDLTVSGNLRRIEVHSNRGDKEAAMTYFTAFIITAPIAAVMYGAKDWHADAAAEGQLTALNRAGTPVWTEELTVSVSETQRTMPTHDAVKTAMSAAVCRKLATTLLNGLVEALTANPAVLHP